MSVSPMQSAIESLIARLERSNLEGVDNLFGEWPNSPEAPPDLDHFRVSLDSVDFGAVIS
jgi:hypothetical protein